MSFSDFIEGNLEAIMAEWRVFARSISPKMEGMTALALDDHGREMLLAIAKDMRSPQSEAERKAKSIGRAAIIQYAPETAAYTHGVTRHLSGFDIDQLVSEFRALRASVLWLWRGRAAAAQAGVLEIEEIARFNEALDQALTESITSYSAKVNYSRNMFLAVLGHDVRGPLSGIVMAAALLESPTLADPLRLQIARRIRRAVDVVGRLTDDLLEYARSRLGSGMPVEQSACDLTDVCEEAVDAVRSAHPTLAISAQFSGDLHTRCDIARMQQALGNLLNNAVQHGDTNQPILLAAWREGGSIFMAVTNQGRPIPPEAFASIFEPMIRLPEVGDSSDQRSRVGLGLYIVKQIAEGHGGGVTVESSDHGTTFSIRLPDSP